MRKSFQVATVFTGTAAAAAAFAPAAGAATAQPAAVHYNCSVGPLTNATVLYWPTSKDHGPTCVSGSGATNLGNTYFTFFCAGHYYGAIHFPNRATRYYGAGSGKGTLDDNVTSVHISAWSTSLLNWCTT